MKRYFLISCVLFSLLNCMNAQATNNKKAFSAFVDAINNHDADKVRALMTDDHSFIDAQNNEMKGADKMHDGWKGYFSWFPDYKIEVNETYEHDNIVTAFGFAEGSYKGDRKYHWRIPASWRAVVENGKIRIWQVYADTKLPFESIHRYNDDHGPAKNNSPYVTSIGGIFFKCKNPNEVKDWYKKHLGLQTDKYGTNFEWRHGDDGSKKGYTQWSPFSENTKYFLPSTREFMINYRVRNLEALVEQLKKDGVTVVDKIESFDYGKFVHILDCENNKIELWEPNDEEYDKIVDGRTK